MYRPPTFRSFSDWDKQLDALYDAYGKLYHLPKIRLEDQLSDRSLFEYCQARKYFAIVLPYTLEGELLLTPDLFSNKLTWKMFGGSVKPAESEEFIHSVLRQVEEAVVGLSLGEIEPIAFLENSFSFQEESHSHLGIAFIGRLRAKNGRDELRNCLKSHPGQLVSFVDHTPMIEHSYQRQLLTLALSRIAVARRMRGQEDEVKSNEENIGRYKKHNSLTKRLLRTASAYFGDQSIPQLEETISQNVMKGKPYSVIDVGCGENSRLINSAVEANVPLVVGTDISWSHIALMRDKRWVAPLKSSSSVLLFTNHDARRLPFGDSALDAALLKNVLHHMPNTDSARLLINELMRVSKRAVVVEVMDPSLEGRWGRFRKWMYMRLLKEPVANMLPPVVFDELTNMPQRVDRFDVKTIRGIYMFAVFQNAAKTLSAKEEEQYDSAP